MADSRINAGVIYKAVLPACGLVIAAMIFHALISLVLGVLIAWLGAVPAPMTEPRVGTVPGGNGS